MLEIKYTSEFKKKIKPYLPILGVLLATAVTAYSTTLDVPEPLPDPIVITKYVEVPGPTKYINVPVPGPTEYLPCDPCPEPPMIIEPEEQPAWYLGGNGDDKSSDTNDNDDTDDNDDDNDNDNGDDDDDCDGHGQSHGGHGGHGQGHGYGHR